MYEQIAPEIDIMNRAIKIHDWALKQLTAKTSPIIAKLQDKKDKEGLIELLHCLPDIIEKYYIYLAIETINEEKTKPQ